MNRCFELLNSESITVGSKEMHCITIQYYEIKKVQEFDEANLDVIYHKKKR